MDGIRWLYIFLGFLEKHSNFHSYCVELKGFDHQLLIFNLTCPIFFIFHSLKVLTAEMLRVSHWMRNDLKMSL